MFWLILALGAVSIVAAGIAAASRPGVRSLGWLAGSFLLAASCFALVLWANCSADAATVLDTVEGWRFGATIVMVVDVLFAAVCAMRLARARRLA